MSENGNAREHRRNGATGRHRLLHAWVLGAASAAAAFGGCGTHADVGESPAGNVHPVDWKNEHGAALRVAAPGSLSAAITPCDECHGTSAAAVGPPVPACDDCHGPESEKSCASCHDVLGGSHETHGATPATIGEAACGLCHGVPGTWRDANHLNDRGDADIAFTGRALAREHAPTFVAGTCNDVACHAGPGARMPAPSWGTTFPEPVCGSCHGLPPPAPHPASPDCEDCHSVVSPNDLRNTENPHPNGEVVVDVLADKACDACHGDPPTSGAHERHLNATIAAPVACETCHLVPAAVEDPGHLDDGVRGVEVVLGAAAGPQAAFEGGQCNNVVCHGQDAPVWADMGGAACGTCHGAPPAGHPEGTCDRCHPSAGPDGRPLDVRTHIDGTVDNRALTADDCGTCHGAGAPVEPPGPHARHARFACSTCHVAPETPQSEGHLNGRVELRVQGLPERDGSPSAPGVFEDGRCSVPTCHGAGQPLWAARETRLACDACHGNPPPKHWPTFEPAIGCEKCHAVETAGSPLTHANGTVDIAFAQDCDACHGAPPASGAHRRHANPEFSRPVECRSCHVAPAAVTDVGHLDETTESVEVALATGTYDPATQTCSGVTCHVGVAGTVPTPVWTSPPGSGAAACGACHAIPPPDHGPVDCVHCHAPSAGPGLRIADPSHHVDGVLDRVGAAALVP